MNANPQRDLIRVARIQRGLLWIILAIIILNVLSFGMTNSLSALLTISIIALLVQILALVQVIRLSIAMRFSIVVTILLVPLMLIPLVNIITLVILNSKATAALQQAGVHVGFMGAPKSEYPKLLPGHCPSCGYNRKGIGVVDPCPECGFVPTPIESRHAE